MNAQAIKAMQVKRVEIVKGLFQCVAVSAFGWYGVLCPAQSSLDHSATRSREQQDAAIRDVIRHNPQLFPEPHFDKVPPAIPAEIKRGSILIFSKTNGYRDSSAIAAANAAFRRIADEQRWDIYETENAAVMNASQLRRFQLVIWNNTSGDSLSAEQRHAFQAWVEGGGSFVGIHGAGGDPTWLPPPRSAAVWKWYVDTLLGAQFTTHAPIVPGNIHIEAEDETLVVGLPSVWRRSDEWYAFDRDPRTKRGFHIIATIDEKTYDASAAHMGADHPLIWWHCVGKGRAVYSALGHGESMYSEPLMVQLLSNLMRWGLDRSAGACYQPQ